MATYFDPSSLIKKRRSPYTQALIKQLMENKFKGPIRSHYQGLSNIANQALAAYLAIDEDKKEKARIGEIRKQQSDFLDAYSRDIPDRITTRRETDPDAVPAGYDPYDPDNIQLDKKAVAQKAIDPYGLGIAPFERTVTDPKPQKNLSRWFIDKVPVDWQNRYDNRRPDLERQTDLKDPRREFGLITTHEKISGKKAYSPQRALEYLANNPDTDPDLKAHILGNIVDEEKELRKFKAKMKYKGQDPASRAEARKNKATEKRRTFVFQKGVEAFLSKAKQTSDALIAALRDNKKAEANIILSGFKHRLRRSLPIVVPPGASVIVRNALKTRGGAAALIRSIYPELSGISIKDLGVKSAKDNTNFQTIQALIEGPHAKAIQEINNFIGNPNYVVPTSVGDETPESVKAKIEAEKNAVDKTGIRKWVDGKINPNNVPGGENKKDEITSPHGVTTIYSAPEKQKSSQDLMLERQARRVMASNTLTDTGNFVKKKIEDFSSSISVTSGLIDNITKMRGLLDVISDASEGKGFTMGAAGDFRKTVSSVVVLFKKSFLDKEQRKILADMEEIGKYHDQKLLKAKDEDSLWSKGRGFITTSRQTLAALEAFKALGNKLALMFRKPSAISGGLLGQTSDRDIGFLLAQVPNLSNTLEGNKLIMDFLLYHHGMEKAVAEEGQRWVGEYGTYMERYAAGQAFGKFYKGFEVPLQKSSLSGHLQKYKIGEGRGMFNKDGTSAWELRKKQDSDEPYTTRGGGGVIEPEGHKIVSLKESMIKSGLHRNPDGSLEANPLLKYFRGTDGSGGYYKTVKGKEVPMNRAEIKAYRKSELIDYFRVGGKADLDSKIREGVARAKVDKEDATHTDATKQKLRTVRVLNKRTGSWVNKMVDPLEFLKIQRNILRPGGGREPMPYEKNYKEDHPAYSSIGE
jgi:hypothetical protein